MKPWGCPQCHSKDSKVDDVDRDGDGYVVRLRVCSRCGYFYSTQEILLGDKSTFFARAENRLDHAWELRHKKAIVCHLCGRKYQQGSWALHVRRPEHRAALKDPSTNDLDRNAARQRERYWKDRYGIPAPPDLAYVRYGKRPPGRKTA